MKMNKTMKKSIMFVLFVFVAEIYAHSHSHGHSHSHVHKNSGASQSRHAAFAMSQRYQNKSEDGRVPAREESGNPLE